MAKFDWLWHLSWRRALRPVLRVFTYTAAVVLPLLAITLLVARLWLPTLAQHKAEIEDFLSEKSAHVVSIREVRPYWEGLHPALRLLGLTVSSPDSGAPVLQLGEIRMSFDWWPLLLGKTESPDLLRSLILVRPELTLRRLQDGRFQFSGFDPQTAAQTEDSGPVMQWLFSQDRLVVEDAVFHWRDERHPNSALSIMQVNISLHNRGDRHQLGISAKFPDTLCRECSFIVDINGNPLLEQSWEGRIYVRARALNLATLPTVVRSQLPEPLRGLFDVQLWSRWQEGRAQKVYGTIQASGLELPGALIAAKGRPVQIRAASAEVEWERENEAWRLHLTDLLLRLTDTPWVAGSLRLEVDPARSRLFLEQLNLHELTRFISGVEPPHPLLDALRGLDPHGTMRNLSVRVDGPLDTPEDFLVEADAQDLTVSSYREFPAVSGVNANITVTKTGGKLDFRGDTGTLFPPTVFRAPLKFQRASGTISWDKEEEGVRVLGRDLRVLSQSGRVRGQFDLFVPPDPTPARLEIRGRLSDGKLPEIYPVLLETTFPWLQRSVYAGLLTNAEVYYSGPVGKYQPGETEFEFLGHVSEGALAYLPDWPDVKQVQAEVFIQGGELLVTGNGRIGKLAAQRIVTHIPDLRAKPGPSVRVTGQVTGALQETLSVLRDTPQGKRLIPGWLAAQGAGTLGLEIAVAAGTPQPVRFKGEYLFQGNHLLMPSGNLALEDLRGSVGFTENGIADARVVLKFLGGDTIVEAAPSAGPPNALVFNASGKITEHGLKRALGPGVDAIGGHATWQGSWSGQAGRRRVRLEADLRDLVLRWPAPLGKPAGAPLRLLATTVADQSETHLVELNLDGRAAGRLLWQRQGEIWSLSKGRVGIGARRVRLPEEPGLQVDIVEPKLDADAWLRYIASRPPDVSSATALPKTVTRVVADIGALALWQRPWGPLHADLTRGPQGWAGVLRGTAVSGKVYIPYQDTDATWQFNLDHLTLPEIRAEELSGNLNRDAHTRLTRLPTVNIRSQSFQVGDRQFGQLSLWAAPEGPGWRIRHLMLSRPETNMFVKGDWRETSDSRKVDVETEINSTDIGATLAAMGVPDQVNGGKAEIKAVLGWEGGPADFHFAGVNGQIQLSAHNGRFVNIKQGPGKLLGLFDIRSIARYLTLDFTSIFGKGYVFDEINGQIRLEAGNAYTQNLTIEGPSANLNIVGRAGLITEDFDLQVSVTPHFREPVTTLGWYWGGPVGAAGAWFLQRIFKKQIAKGTRMVYIIKGPWQDPLVERVVKEPGQS